MAKRLSLILAALAAFGFALPAALHPQQKGSLPPTMWEAPRQTVTVDDFPAQGLILDIGGGGEGVIGQLKGRQVVAIDLLKRELEEAPAGPLLKIVMDARELKFLDGSFPTTTVFFTFMYIDSADHEKVFREIHRVLAPGGRLLIWDVVFPSLEDKRKTSILFPFTFNLPGREIRTGYGVRIPPGEQGRAHFEALAARTGFSVVAGKTVQSWFFLELAKPRTAE